MRAIAYYASRDLVPWYGVYALLFLDSGLSAAEVSSLFLIWSLTSFVFEIPSGAWADTVDRRRLLVLSGVLNAAAWAAWLGWPTYAGFAVGFFLWGLSGALMSGTFEALVYDVLAAHGEASAYAGLMGRAEAATVMAALLGTVVAAPLYAIGGYPLVGVVSVVVAGVHTVLAATLPGRPSAPVVESVDESVDGSLYDEEPDRGYVVMLRAGVREASTTPRVRRLVVVLAVVVGIAAYDEYFALVAREDGVSTTANVLLVTLTAVGQVVGTAFAGRTVGARWRLLGGAVAVAAVLVSVGALAPPLGGFLLIAVGYGLLSNAMIVTEARLQDAITGPARATVTSVSGVAIEAVVLAVYGFVGVLSGLLRVTLLVALLGIPLAVTGLAMSLGPRALRLRRGRRRG